jgi:hypothetical protein
MGGFLEVLRVQAHDTYPYVYVLCACTRYLLLLSKAKYQLELPWTYIETHLNAFLSPQATFLHHEIYNHTTKLQERRKIALKCVIRVHQLS